jgi:hypothetical protein
VITVIHVIFQQNYCREYKQTPMKRNNIFYKEVTSEVDDSAALQTAVTNFKTNKTLILRCSNTLRAIISK